VHNCSPEIYPSDKLEIIGRIGFTFDDIVNDLVEDGNWSSDSTNEKGLGAKERVNGSGEELIISSFLVVLGKGRGEGRLGTDSSEQDLLNTILTSRLDQVEGECDPGKDIGEENKLDLSLIQ
jgi:hypothetical protein